jgi:formylglycine-generating enzyme required for sulfatase activity
MDASKVAPPVVPTGVDPDAWARVPAGEFLMGLHYHETMVDYDYEIMVTNVTNAQYARYLNHALEAGDVQRVGDQIVGYYPGDVFHGHEHEKQIEAGDWLHILLDDPGLRLRLVDGEFRAIRGYGNHPMVLVTWFGARAYCEFYGWRLPSEVEWEKAARGSDGRPFPWGSEIERNQANFYSSHDLFEKIVGGQGDTTPVGFYNGKTYDDYTTLKAVSPYGLFDMAGNVWQWTGDVYEDQHYRYMRGGSRMDYAYNLRVWTRNSAGPDYYSPSVGFRCAREAVD